MYTYDIRAKNTTLQLMKAHSWAEMFYDVLLVLCSFAQ